jgi:hypothetical protein
MRDEIQVDFELVLDPSRGDRDYTGWARWFLDGDVFHLGSGCGGSLQPLYAGMGLDEMRRWHILCPICTGVDHGR